MKHVTVAAKLIYLSRRETVPFSIPPHLPLNREAALEAGRMVMGPTGSAVPVRIRLRPAAQARTTGTSWKEDAPTLQGTLGPAARAMDDRAVWKRYASSASQALEIFLIQHRGVSDAHQLALGAYTHIAPFYRAPFPRLIESDGASATQHRLSAHRVVSVSVSITPFATH
ncbi:hypothetical protein B0H16DRAFT_1745553 [Mycena metata]|uniref:Uncharacterized protein n=1 Tax=Mycena metata TaxID=1033252 RepID=A0AAD7H2C9_9AGAR|nr:hypothetical protein B0H16DRAFT_1745553 [Mycena metata]